MISHSDKESRTKRQVYQAQTRHHQLEDVNRSKNTLGVDWGDDKKIQDNSKGSVLDRYDENGVGPDNIEVVKVSTIQTAIDNQVDGSQIRSSRSPSVYETKGFQSSSPRYHVHYERKETSKHHLHGLRIKSEGTEYSHQEDRERVISSSKRRIKQEKNPNHHKEVRGITQPLKQAKVSPLQGNEPEHEKIEGVRDSAPIKTIQSPAKLLSRSSNKRYNHQTSRRFGQSHRVLRRSLGQETMRETKKGGQQDFKISPYVLQRKSKRYHVHYDRTNYPTYRQQPSLSSVSRQEISPTRYGRRYSGHSNILRTPAISSPLLKEDFSNYREEAKISQSVPRRKSRRYHVHYRRAVHQPYHLDDAKVGKGRGRSYRRPRRLKRIKQRAIPSKKPPSLNPRSQVQPPITVIKQTKQPYKLVSHKKYRYFVKPQDGLYVTKLRQGFQDKKIQQLRKMKAKVLVKSDLQPKKFFHSRRLLGKTLMVSQIGLASYLQTGNDENIALEASNNLLRTSSFISYELKPKKRYAFFDKKKSLTKLDRKLKEREVKLIYRKNVALLRKDKKKSNLRAFLKRRQMKATIKKKFQTRLRDRIKDQLLRLLKVITQWLVYKVKRLGPLAIGLLLLLGLIVQVGNMSFVGLSQVVTSLTTSTYLSSEQMLVAINQSYSTRELNLDNSLSRLEQSHPGYDKYEVKREGTVGHNIHVLLSYITAKFGEVKSLSEVEPELESLFQEAYKVTYRGKSETRQRKVVKDGKTVTETYTYRTLIAIVKVTDLEMIVRKRLSAKQTDHYDILLSTQGNYGDLFGSEGTSPSSPNGVSSLYQFNVSGGSFPPPDPNHVAGLNGGVAGQCTWYVYNRFSQLGKPIRHAPMGNGGEWAFYAQNYGYQVTRNARAGTAICFPPWVAGSHPTYGHIAFVEKVNSDGSVLISEMNAVGEFIISTRTLSKAEASQCYYINFGL